MGGLRPVQSHWSFFRSSSSNPASSNKQSRSSSVVDHNVNDISIDSSSPKGAIGERQLFHAPSLPKLRALVVPPTAKDSTSATNYRSVQSIDHDCQPSIVKKAKSYSHFRAPRAVSLRLSKRVHYEIPAQTTSTWEMAALEKVLPRHLAILPCEVWDVILSYLSSADKAFLALSCHFLQKILTPKAFKEINTCSCKLEKLEFLRYFHAHLPDHVLCPKCATFHYHGKKHFHLKSNELLNHVSQQFMQRDCVQRAAKAYLFDTHKLEWWQVQMIMRAQLISPRYGIRPRALCLESHKPHGPWYTCSEAVVADGHLLVKVHSARPFDFRSRKCQNPEIDEDFPSCSHLNEKTTLTKACQQVTSSAREPYPGNPSFMRESTLYRCEWCPSEYQAELRSVESDESRAAAKARKKDCRFLLCVTRWIDAGEGLKSDSDEWFALTTIRKHCGQGAAYRGYPYNIGNVPAIKYRYEGSDHTAGTAPVQSICVSVKPE